MREIPRGLVGDVQSALQLISGNTLFGFDDEVGGEEPLPKRKVGIMKDSASGNGEVIAA
jgi:hypothetical protein